MKLFLVSLSIGTALALVVYLCLAIPKYKYLADRQPGGVHETEITSYPPRAAFVLMLPFAVLTLIVATSLLWLGQWLLVQ